jgi:putative membrane protein
MNRFLLRWGINTIALYIAIQLLPGLQHTGSGVTLLGVALLFGLVNAVLKPVLVILSCPLVLLSLGLFMLVINGLLLLLTARLSVWLDWGFTVDGLGWGIIGSIVISLVGFVFTALLAPDED